MRCFGDAKDTIDTKQLRNHVYLLRFGHTSALLLKKKMLMLVLWRQGGWSNVGERLPTTRPGQPGQELLPEASDQALPLVEPP